MHYYIIKLVEFESIIFAINFDVISLSKVFINFDCVSINYIVILKKM